MKVLMLPTPNPDKPGTSGIARVAEAYHRHLPSFGVEMVHPDAADYDLLSLHVADSHRLVDERPMVLHNHGLHWTADYNCRSWQHAVNSTVIDAIRKATVITVPSPWVAESFQRDLRYSPTVIPHGIDWDDWQEEVVQGDYVLWNKNRAHDVCDSTPVMQLARAHSKAHFVTTFLPEAAPTPTNTNVIGLIPYDQMKRLVQSALVYLSSTKETFGIGVLEAMASGVPVLGYAHGGNVALVEHGVNGYLATPGDVEDLIEGLNYCLLHRDTLGENGREMARRWTWEDACEKVAGVYRETLEPTPPTVAIVIPTYNKTEEQLGRAVRSATSQTYGGVTDVIVIDDGSDDSGVAESVGRKFRDNKVKVVRVHNQGVANARNRGIAETSTKYVCCLDADDAIRPEFIETCVEALESDRSLGIAYTSLHYTTPDGREGVSEWPSAWDYDLHLKRQNQVPTCCVFRREMWERLGGYRQRYAPLGAGEEDAEFFLRAGAYGWRAEKVTEEPLFLYSWQSGIVSGNKSHPVTDWTSWHPWVNDRQHPFPSYATPMNKIAHRVRQYDEPSVSVVIPVGPGHEATVINALDSLEAQGFRKWEVIVVYDGGYENVETIKELVRHEKSYPYVRWVGTTEHIGPKPMGPGFARNRGAEIARAPFLLFLDADDWLYPDCLERMVGAWNEHQKIVYTDYVGKAIVSPSDLAEDLQERVYSFNEKTGEAVIGYRAFDYDCELAQAQPRGDRPYIWCNVTSLIPKLWHEEVGGFDESLPSWEDVDYHWRLAKAGRCYYRIERELLVYNFHHGHRRELGRQEHRNLLDYLKDKHGGIQPMGCRGCGGRGGRMKQQTQVFGAQQAQQQTPDDADFIQVRYMSPNRGKHQVTGHALMPAPIPGWRMIRRSPETWSINYGHRGGGSKFLVHRDDVAAQPVMFVPVDTQQIISAPQVEKVVEPPRPLTEEVEERVGEVAVEAEEPTAPVDHVATPASAIGMVDSILSVPTGESHAAFDVQALPGINKETAELLKADGIDSREKLVALGVDGLQAYKGIGETRAQWILKAIGGLNGPTD